MASHLEKDSSSTDSQLAKATTKDTGSAAFQAQYFVRRYRSWIDYRRHGNPLTIGIAIMSDYPIKVGLATVAFASFIGWINAWFKPGNYIGSPGIARWTRSCPCFRGCKLWLGEYGILHFLDRNYASHYLEI